MADSEVIIDELRNLDSGAKKMPEQQGIALHETNRDGPRFDSQQPLWVPQPARGDFLVQSQA